MIELFSTNLLPFTLSLILMLLIVLIEGVGLLIGATLSTLLDSIFPDFESDIVVDTQPTLLTKILGWINIGRVPLLVIIISFLTIFGLSGVLIQYFMDILIGIYLNIYISIVISIFIAFILSKSFTNLIHKIMPKDESSVINESEFIGKTAIIILGRSSKENPAEAKYIDNYGQAHYLMVEPEDENIFFEQGENILISKKSKKGFYGIKNSNKILNQN